MARTRVYIKPFDAEGAYADWIDVSDDVYENGVGSIKQALDKNPSDTGSYRNQSLSLTMNNIRGKYSDVGGQYSIFQYKRSDSLVKVTWDLADQEFIAGSSFVDDVLNEEVVLFTGLLNDESLTMNLSDTRVAFTVLALDSVLDRDIVPFADIAAGDTIKSIIFDCLNQANITALLNVDLANIDPAINLVTDSISRLENKTVAAALKDLLADSCSVLFVENATVYVTARTPAADVTAEFYGQASESRPENIIEIKSIRSGLARLFNFITWKETSLSSIDTDSVTLYGYRKPPAEVTSDQITNNTKRQQILDNIRDEFADPKQEFSLITDLNYTTAALGLLSRVSIDYPELLLTSGDDLPKYGEAIYGEAEYPRSVSAFSVLSTEHYKVMGKEINTEKLEVTLSLREI